MTAQAPEATSIGNQHDFSECPYPHFHYDGDFNQQSADTLMYARETNGNAAPLCLFGGGTPGGVGGTFTVCPNCSKVYSCGWDQDQVRPSQCGYCHEQLTPRDYFQPATDGAYNYVFVPEQSRSFLTVELLALSPNGEIRGGDLSLDEAFFYLVRLMNGRGLLTRAGHFAKDFELSERHFGVPLTLQPKGHPRLDDWAQNGWFYGSIRNPGSENSTLSLSPAGQAIAKSRSLGLSETARDTLKGLLTLPSKELWREAMLAHLSALQSKVAAW